jgi:hypothetical protein
MPAFTSPDNLPHESLTLDQPTSTLNGGSSGTVPKLADRVQTALTDIRSDVQTAQETADDAEARAKGWTRINEGSATDSFSIDLTVSGLFSTPLPFSLVRIYLRGNFTTGARLNCRVNADSTAALYWNTFEVRELGDQDILESNSADQTVWTVGRWSSFTGGICTMTIFGTDAQALLAHESTAFSPSSDTAARYRTVAQGRLNASRTLTSVNFFPSSGGISAVRWWAEGWRGD